MKAFVYPFFVMVVLSTAVPPQNGDTQDTVPLAHGQSSPLCQSTCPPKGCGGAARQSLAWLEGNLAFQPKSAAFPVKQTVFVSESRPAIPAPLDAYKIGLELLRKGQFVEGIQFLEVAAEGGVPDAIWKLGRVFADGDGVGKDELRALRYFSILVGAHFDNSEVAMVYSGYIADAFVSLGHLHLRGIPNTRIKANPTRALEMYEYAARYFGDPDAQYHAGRVHYEGIGKSRDSLTAGRWLRLAANKGHCRAQALLGTMFAGGDLGKQYVAQALFWLTIAKDGKFGQDPGIIAAYKKVYDQAKVDERARTLELLKRWQLAKSPQ